MHPEFRFYDRFTGASKGMHVLLDSLFSGLKFLFLLRTPRLVLGLVLPYVERGSQFLPGGGNCVTELVTCLFS